MFYAEKVEWITHDADDICEVEIKKRENECYKHPQFGEIRCMMDEKGDPWFVGKDVAVMLKCMNPSKAIRDHVDIDDKTTRTIRSGGLNYKTNVVIINESGLYALILSSKLPQALSQKGKLRWHKISPFYGWNCPEGE